MLDQILEFFEIFPEYDLDLMKAGTTLSELTVKFLIKLDSVLATERPDLVFVQGDTTTVMTAALSSFYDKIPVAHLEAGLRTGNRYSPFPEEANRILTGHLSSLHFAPTKRAVASLERENIKSDVYNVGNTVIDALNLGLSITERVGESRFTKFFSFVDLRKKILLVTGHRRENIGQPIHNICDALKITAMRYPDVEIIYPVHPNPGVRKPVFDTLHGIRNIHLIEPLNYPQMIWIMNRSYFVITDSGCIQEEAQSLGKPVLITREVTERQEGVDAGVAKLVGTNIDNIVWEI
jgi:UDP-N-acetylglucosamine 2-epimerase (non-hydrolysing)